MIYLVLDLCQGGDLYVRDPYEEWEAKEIMTQLMMAVGYMHRRGIVHRDLKYENVMFVEPRHGKSRLEIKVSVCMLRLCLFWFTVIFVGQ